MHENGPEGDDNWVLFKALCLIIKEIIVSEHLALMWLLLISSILNSVQLYVLNDAWLSLFSRFWFDV